MYNTTETKQRNGTKYDNSWKIKNKKTKKKQQQLYMQ